MRRFEARLERTSPQGRERLELAYDACERAVVARLTPASGEPVEQRKPFNSGDVAREQIARMIERRQQDGWQRVDLGNPRNPELEAAIRAAPEDPQAVRVYADWLSERGSLHGELLQRQTDSQLADWRDARLDELFGSAADAIASGQVTLQWEGCWIESLAARYLALASPSGLETPLRAVLEAPAACRMRSLEIDPRCIDALDPLLASLVASPPPLERLRLSFGAHQAGPLPAEGGLSYTVDGLGALIRELPSLRELTCCFSAELAPSQSLESLGVYVDDSTRGAVLLDQLRDLEQLWPRLRRLELVTPVRMIGPGYRHGEHLLAMPIESLLTELRSHPGLEVRYMPHHIRTQRITIEEATTDRQDDLP